MNKNNANWYLGTGAILILLSLVNAFLLLNVATSIQHKEFKRLISSQFFLVDQLPKELDSPGEWLSQFEQNQSALRQLSITDRLPGEKLFYHLSRLVEKGDMLVSALKTDDQQRQISDDIKQYSTELSKFAIQMSQTPLMSQKHKILISNQFILLFLLIGVVFFPLVNHAKYHRLQHAEKSELLHSLKHNSDCAIFSVSNQGVIDEVNRETENIFSCKRSDLLGQSINEFLSIEGQENVHVALSQIAGTGVSTAFFGQRKFDESFPLEVSVHTYVKNRQPYLLVLVRDISDREKAEVKVMQAQKMEAIGQLTGGIAHDFNNLLLIIQGNLRLVHDNLSKSGDNVEDLELLTDALSATKDGSDLTDRLLSFSRKQALKPERSNVNTLIDDFCRFIDRTIGQSIDLSVSLKSNLPAMLIDRNQLQNAILNLALNARDAMPDGGELRISTNIVKVRETRKENGFHIAPGDYVAVIVSDTGVGMSEDIRKKVFDPFFTTKGPGSGSGMGLSMVYGFVKQSEGGISVKSTPGRGTIVTLLLPTTQKTAEAPLLIERPKHPQLPSRKQPSDVELQATAGSSKKLPVLKQIKNATVPDRELPTGAESILVVDDEERVRKFACTCLRELGYNVFEASSGDEAHALLTQRNHGFDIIFCDMIMPGKLSGTQLAEWTLKMRPNTLVLITTGYSSGTHGNAHNNYNILYKPYTKKDLAYQLRLIIDKAKRQKRLSEKRVEVAAR